MPPRQTRIGKPSRLRPGGPPPPAKATPVCSGLGRLSPDRPHRCLPSRSLLAGPAYLTSGAMSLRTAQGSGPRLRRTMRRRAGPRRGGDVIKNHPRTHRLARCRVRRPVWEGSARIRRRTRRQRQQLHLREKADDARPPALVFRELIYGSEAVTLSSLSHARFRKVLDAT